MNATITKPKNPSRTRIVFDLADELSPEEIAAFEARAKEAGAKNLTEHFLNIALRVEPKNAA